MSMEKQFNLPGRAYYSSNLGKKDNEIYISYFDKESGKQADFNIQWVELSNKRVPRLRMFDDCWTAFSMVPELFIALESIDGQNASIDMVVNILTGLGFKDATTYKMEGSEESIKEMEQIREGYLKKIDELTERIKRLS